MNRHVGSDGACPVCHGAAEDIKHLLFECFTARELWRGLGILEILDEAATVDRSGSVILEHLLLAEDKPVPMKPNLDIKKILAVGSWHLWWTRRQHTHDGATPPPMRWPMSVLAIANNFHQANEKNRVTNEQRWLKPSPKFVKLNVDASFYADEGAGASAAILRDEKGNFLAAQCKYIQYASDVVTSEAMAMRDGLIFASSLGFNRVEAESDSSIVIDYCSGQTEWWDSAAAVFAECVDVSLSIGKVIFKHCARSSNQAAHVLASYCFCNKICSSWTYEPPTCLVSKLIDDVIPI